jgi:hypothetical protein
VPRGRSASSWRTVRAARVPRVFFVFLLAFRFEFWLDEVSDGPRVLGGRSAGAWRTVRVLPADGPLFAVRLWWFCVFYQTVRGVGPDSLRC